MGWPTTRAQNERRQFMPEKKERAAQGGEAGEIKSIAKMSMEELRSLPRCDASVVKRSIQDKKSSVARFEYYCDVRFDFLTKLHFRLTAEEFGLIATVMVKDSYVGDEIKVSAPVRSIRTEFEGGKTILRFDVALCDYVRKTFSVEGDSTFARLFDMRLKAGYIDKAYSPIERKASPKEAFQVTDQEQEAN